MNDALVIYTKKISLFFASVVKLAFLVSRVISMVCTLFLAHPPNLVTGLAVSDFSAVLLFPPARSLEYLNSRTGLQLRCLQYTSFSWIPAPSLFTGKKKKKNLTLMQNVNRSNSFYHYLHFPLLGLECKDFL